jgi:hypothetical protein
MTDGRTMRPPFHCDYGHHTFVGARTFANFGLMCLVAVGNPARVVRGVEP